LTDKTIARPLAVDRRQIVYLMILGVAVFLFVPKLIGFRHVLLLLQVAHPTFLVLALGAETLRYFVSAGSTIVLARLFEVTIPTMPMTEAFFAGAAANRTFSTGGAPGMIIRFAFLTREGLPPGAVAVIFLIEDIIGTAIGVMIFFVGILTVTNALPDRASIAEFSVIAGLVSPLILLVGWRVYRHRAWVEKIVHAVAPAINRPLEWFFGRPILTWLGVQRALDDFYAGMSIARRSPLNVAASFLFNIVRYLAGAAALYFSFYAMQWTISPGALILIFTTVSFVSSVSAVPGEVAIMGTSMALLSFAFGVPGDIAVMSLLLSRAIAFWLPIPVGYAALWHLRRQQLL
jgi:uncharacterized protein (TIRG00374 family)